MKQYKTQGMIGVIIAIIVALVVLAAAGYYLISSGKLTGGSSVKPTAVPFYSPAPYASPTPSATTSAVSGSTDLKVIDTELKSTTVDSVDSDFQQMNASASGL